MTDYKIREDILKFLPNSADSHDFMDAVKAADYRIVPIHTVQWIEIGPEPDTTIAPWDGEEYDLWLNGRRYTNCHWQPGTEFAFEGWQQQSTEHWGYTFSITGEFYLEGRGGGNPSHYMPIPKGTRAVITRTLNGVIVLATLWAIGQGAGLVWDHYRAAERQHRINACLVKYPALSPQICASYEP